MYGSQFSKRMLTSNRGLGNSWGLVAQRGPGGSTALGGPFNNPGYVTSIDPRAPNQREKLGRSSVYKRTASVVYNPYALVARAGRADASLTPVQTGSEFRFNGSAPVYFDENGNPVPGPEMVGVKETPGKTQRAPEAALGGGRTIGQPSGPAVNVRPPLTVNTNVTQPSPVGTATPTNNVTDPNLYAPQAPWYESPTEPNFSISPQAPWYQRLDSWFDGPMEDTALPASNASFPGGFPAPSDDSRTFDPEQDPIAGSAASSAWSLPSLWGGEAINKFTQGLQNAMVSPLSPNFWHALYVEDLLAQAPKVPPGLSDEENYAQLAQMPLVPKTEPALGSPPSPPAFPGRWDRLRYLNARRPPERRRSLSPGSNPIPQSARYPDVEPFGGGDVDKAAEAMILDPIGETFKLLQEKLKEKKKAVEAFYSKRPSVPLSKPRFHPYTRPTVSHRITNPQAGGRAPVADGGRKPVMVEVPRPGVWTPPEQVASVPRIDTTSARNEAASSGLRESRLRPGLKIETGGHPTSRQRGNDYYTRGRIAEAKAAPKKNDTSLEDLGSPNSERMERAVSGAKKAIAARRNKLGK